jgi:hypothetical protein
MRGTGSSTGDRPDRGGLRPTGEEPGPIALDHPAFAPIPTWLRISGLTRTATYNALSRGDLVAIKVGRRTLIDVQAGISWLRSLPKATFRDARD